MGAIQHVCLDKDGTLTDVHTYWADIITKRADRVLTAFSLPPGYLSPLVEAMGVDSASGRILPAGPVGYKPRSVVIAAAVDQLERWDIDAAEDGLASIFRDVDQELLSSRTYHVEVLPGTHEALRTLKGAGLKLSIYTSDRLDALKEILRAHDLERYFDAEVGGDEVRNPKPDPEGFRTACHRVGVDVRESAYVGDTADDMRMAASGGSAGGLGVACGLCSAADLLRFTTLVFDDLLEVAAFVAAKK